MSDLALAWDNGAFGADLGMDAGQLATDAGLRTAILISLFTDARARVDDVLPSADADRRGWWGNAFPSIEEDRPAELGSRLWLLDRAKTVASVTVRAREYVREALQWLIDDGIAASVEALAERQSTGSSPVLAIGVVLTRPGGAATQRFDFLWEAS